MRTLAVIAMLGAALLAGPAVAQPADGAGSAWVPVRLGANVLPAAAPQLLWFGADGAFRAEAGCNRYVGRYRLSGTALRFGPLGGTRARCAPAVMHLETTFFAALKTVRQVRRDGRILRLLDADGREIATLVRAGGE